MIESKDRIRKLLDELQMDVPQFAAWLGVPSSTMRSLANGTRSISKAMAVRLAQRCNLNLEWALLGSGPQRRLAAPSTADVAGLAEVSAARPAAAFSDGDHDLYAEIIRRVRKCYGEAGVALADDGDLAAAEQVYKKLRRFSRGPADRAAVLDLLIDEVKTGLRRRRDRLIDPPPQAKVDAKRP